MNKKDFIKKLLEIYEDFTERNTKARTEAYMIALDHDLDFDKIYKMLIKEYQSFKFAPTPAYIINVIVPKVEQEEKKLKPCCNEKGEIDINVYNPSL